MASNPLPIILAAVALLLLSGKKDDAQVQQSVPGPLPEPEPEPGPDADEPSGYSTLTRSQMRTIQRQLEALAYMSVPPDVIDGLWRANGATFYAVSAFQTDYDLGVDGKPGSNTRDALKAVSEGTSHPTNAAGTPAGGAPAYTVEVDSGTEVGDSGIVYSWNVSEGNNSAFKWSLLSDSGHRLSNNYGYTFRYTYDTKDEAMSGVREQILLTETVAAEYGLHGVDPTTEGCDRGENLNEAYLAIGIVGGSHFRGDQNNDDKRPEVGDEKYGWDIYDGTLRMLEVDPFPGYERLGWGWRVRVFVRLGGGWEATDKYFGCQNETWEYEDARDALLRWFVDRGVSHVSAAYSLY